MTTFGLTIRRVGLDMLRIIEVFFVILKFENDQIYDAIDENRILMRIVFLFFQSPTNNILHNSCISIFDFILERRTCPLFAYVYNISKFTILAFYRKRSYRPYGKQVHQGHGGPRQQEA